jgi:catechol 2,3-dioxygenase-like lactoylglutathione lyase family enzyme
VQLTHVRLLVHDYLTCLHFWRDTVGLPVVFGDEGGTYASFDTGSAHLSIYVASEMASVVPIVEPSRDAPPRALVQLDVERVDSSVERLRARGVAVSEPSDQPEWGIRVAHFRDPEGNQFELAERLPDRG